MSESASPPSNTSDQNQDAGNNMPNKRKRSQVDVVSEELVDDSKWKEGDFTLISSDNVRFRVDSCFVFAASSVFRDARGLSGNNDKTIDFTDPAIETAETIRLFLSLATSAKLPFGFRNLPYVTVSERVARLTTFLQKYGCEPTIQSLKASIYFEFLSRRWNRRDGFPGIIVGSMTDDVDFCIQAMDAGVQISPTESEDPINKCRGAAHDLLPYNMPYRVARFIPIDYTWALSYSWTGEKKDWPKAFRSLMEKIKASHKSSE